jgi:DNA-directed RNA polymerase specialized sigma24 family protein
MPEHSDGSREQQKEVALQHMERALAILAALRDQSFAASSLVEAIDLCMGSRPMSLDPGEFWDNVDNLPHLTDRALFLHRQNGLGIEQIAARLGIAPKEAAERLGDGLRLVRGFPAVGARH